MMCSPMTLICRSLVTLLVVIFVAGQGTNAFHVYDIATSDVLKRDAESLLMSSAVSATDSLQPYHATSRFKRYTDFQENALAICCGDCMYSLRTTYSQCFDLCNWNGRMPSPWERYERQQQEQQQTSVKQLNSNDVHRMLTPRVGQRKTPGAAAPTTAPRRLRPDTSSPGRARNGRRRLRPSGSGRNGDKPGRRRNTGARRKNNANNQGGRPANNQTCWCPCE